jgi:hypothetical protein
MNSFLILYVFAPLRLCVKSICYRTNKNCFEFISAHSKS